MKRLFFLLTILPAFAFAQHDPLMAEGTSPGLYLTHKVAPKENYYSIGRLYNCSPKDQIAPFNKLQMDKGLSPGQIIKIPLVENNFLQKGKAADDESLIPVYHKVGEKEGLYRVSVNHNKVPLETLKQWNNIKGDAVSVGTNLIVGYLKVKTALSAFSGNATTPPVATVIKDPVDPGKPVIGDPPQPPVKNPVTNPVVVTPQADPVQPVKEHPAPSEVVKSNGDNFNGGVFKSIYTGNNIIKETGEAGVFKSTSGWEDGKYYCLHNSAQPGTIIKVTNNATGKSIYAKVLDMIPDIKQNAGLIIRISNAAGDVLGAGENKFECSISYSK